MRRSLEIWESLQDKELNTLHMSLLTPGVNKLVCPDYNTLWALAGQERQEDLQIVARRVAVLGLRCVDTRLQCLLSIIQNVGAGGPASSDADVENLEATPQEIDTLFKFFREQIDAINNLKWEMEALQLLHTRVRVHGETHKMADVAEQEDVVTKVQLHCIWSQELDLIVRILVMMVATLRKRILFMFGPMLQTNVLAPQSLGKFGLALHYAHIIIFIEKIVNFPSMVMGSSREDLYSMLPRDVQSGLRNRLRQRNGRPMDADLESRLKRSMSLLPPLAHNTLSWQSAHTPGSNYFPKHVVFKVQTLEFAQKEAVNEILLDALTALCCICGGSIAPYPTSRPKSASYPYSHPRPFPTPSAMNQPRNGQTIPTNPYTESKELPNGDGSLIQKTDPFGRSSQDKRERWNGFADGVAMETGGGNLAYGYNPPPTARLGLRSHSLGRAEYSNVPSNLNAPIRIHVEDANGVDWLNAFNESASLKDGNEDISQERTQEKKDVNRGTKVPTDKDVSDTKTQQPHLSNISDVGKEGIVKKLSFDDEVSTTDGGAHDEKIVDKMEGDLSEYTDEKWDHPGSNRVSLVMDSLSLYVKERMSKSNAETKSSISSHDWNDMVKGMMEKMEGNPLSTPPPLMPASAIKSKEAWNERMEGEGNPKRTVVASGSEKSRDSITIESKEKKEGVKGTEGYGGKTVMTERERIKEAVNGSKNSTMDSPPLAKENEIKQEWLNISSAINQVKQQKKFPTSAYERPWKYLPPNLQTPNSRSNQTNNPSDFNSSNGIRKVERSKSLSASWSESQFRELRSTLSTKSRTNTRPPDILGVNGGGFNVIRQNHDTSVINDSVAMMRRSDGQIDFRGMWKAGNPESNSYAGSLIRPNQRINRVQSMISQSGDNGLPNSNRAGFR